MQVNIMALVSLAHIGIRAPAIIKLIPLSAQAIMDRTFIDN